MTQTQNSTTKRKAELGEITMDNVTDDASAVLVTGKGRKQRWMPLGHSAQAALWDYLSVRRSESPSLWVDNNGAGMWPDWLKSMLKRLGIQSEFAAGLRITDAATIEIVEMVLAGSVNKQIVGYINEAGGKAVGLSGKDGNMVKASKTTRTMVDPDSHIEKAVDLGLIDDFFKRRPDDDGDFPLGRAFTPVMVGQVWQGSAPDLLEQLGQFARDHGRPGTEGFRHVGQ